MDAIRWLVESMTLSALLQRSPTGSNQWESVHYIGIGSIWISNFSVSTNNLELWQATIKPHGMVWAWPAELLLDFWSCRTVLTCWILSRLLPVRATQHNCVFHLFLFAHGQLDNRHMSHMSIPFFLPSPPVWGLIDPTFCLIYATDPAAMPLATARCLRCAARRPRVAGSVHRRVPMASARGQGCGHQCLSAVRRDDSAHGRENGPLGGHRTTVGQLEGLRWWETPTVESIEMVGVAASPCNVRVRMRILKS